MHQSGDLIWAHALARCGFLSFLTGALKQSNDSRMGEDSPENREVSCQITVQLSPSGRCWSEFKVWSLQVRTLQIDEEQAYAVQSATQLVDVDNPVRTANARSANALGTKI